MFHHRKERAELLEELVISDKDATTPVLPQVNYRFTRNFTSIEIYNTESLVAFYVTLGITLNQSSFAKIILENHNNCYLIIIL